MGKDTPTFEKVKQAVKQLESEGRPVNCREIRKAIGEGSMSMISQHLRRLKEKKPLYLIKS
jgi:SOS-response transcriptional repressor LexA